MRSVRNAEGRTCAICGRRMLTGETYQVMDHRGRRQYRRSVCALCRRGALTNGWEPTEEIPRVSPTDLPPVAEE